MKILYIIIFLFLITGCANKKEVIKIERINTYKNKQEKKQNFLTCNDLKEIINTEEIKYLDFIGLGFDNSKTLESISKEFYKIYYLNVFFNMQGCYISIDDYIYKKTKYAIVNIFLSEIDIDNFIQQNIDFIKTLVKNNNQNFKIIAETYKKEIESFSPFTTDTEIWNEYIETPLKKNIYELDAIFIQNSEFLLLKFLNKINQKFINEITQVNFLINPIDTNNMIIFRYPKFQYKAFNVNKNEEDALSNTFSSVLEWTPFVGDILTIVNSFSKKCPSSNKNCQKALKYIQKELNYWKNNRIKYLQNQKFYLYESLKTHFMKILALPHIKIELKGEK